MGYKRKFTGPMAARKRIRSMKKRQTRRVFSAKGRSRIAKICKKVLFQKSETKRAYYSHGKFELWHNADDTQHNANICTLNPETAQGMPNQGTGDTSDRIGDEIYMTGFKLRFLCGQKFDRPNVNWRLIIGAVPKNYAYAYNTFFNNISGNVLLDPVNTDLVSILHQSYFKPNAQGVPGTSNAEYTIAKQLWIPRKKKYKFSTNTAQTHNDQQILMILHTYDAYGTLTTDNIGYVQVWQETIFKDF